jgi:phosphate uptake regulator
MKRKIVQHGSSSLTVTLPYSWVKKYDLKKGDELSCEINGSKIEFSTGSDVQINRKEVDVTEFGLFTRNNLTHLYEVGYDEVVIRLHGERSLGEIKKRIGELIGFEIIDIDEKKIMVKSIAHTMEQDFDIMLRKSFLIIKQMGEEVYDAISRKEYSRLKEIFVA